MAWFGDTWLLNTRLRVDVGREAWIGMPVEGGGDVTCDCKPYQTVRHLFQQEGQKVRQAQRSDTFGPTFTAEQCRVRGEDATCLITGADGFHVPLITDREQRKRRENASVG